ncbi:uncharacterized protein LOC132628281 [Lycium barbarum]|uniref:uncharacterized protein LOC132628281 n=1 Tax=Lycium barbarum TaxID=112863 RepID=UPI00293E6DE1|nr:uncharacterized protein LOC132628281 [Lycium barbarum]
MVSSNYDTQSPKKITPVQSTSNQAEDASLKNPNEPKEQNTKNPKPTTSKNNNFGPSKPKFSAVVGTTLVEQEPKQSQVEIKHGTHLGKPAVFFNAREKDCKWTIVAKFVKGKPTMDELRKLLASQIELKANVKVMIYQDLLLTLVSPYCLKSTILKSSLK